MKKVFLTLCCACVTANLFAQDAQNAIPTFEVGVIVGEPTGLSAKYWFAPPNAIDAALGWSFTEGRLDLHADYLFNYFWPDFPRGQLPIFIGLGAVVQIDDDTFLGARVPVGVEYLFDEARLSVFAEIAPVFELIPETELELDGGVGIRFTF